MDVFRLRDQIVQDYASFVSSFVRIRDSTIADLVRRELEEGVLWPDPQVQLNPAFMKGESIHELVQQGILHPTCRDIFRLDKVASSPGKPIRLHKHQADAVKLAAKGNSYVLTTGTGSGKSLAYIIPIVDYVLRNGSGNGIKAIIVYPMNALANSQCLELEKFLYYGFPEGKPPVTFDRYTGQESEEKRAAIREAPPDILLTNYVMLELILTRREDRPLVRAARGARYFVLDEFHTYRGRQGADVAMLVRRVREALDSPQLQCVGTSATLAAGSSRAEMAEEVARAASALFGNRIEPEHVIGETLQRITEEQSPDDEAVVNRLRRRIEDPNAVTPTDFEKFRGDPLVSWIESTFGITKDPHTGELIRQKPRSITGERGASSELSRLTAVEESKCRAAIEEALLAGSQCLKPEENEPAFAFRIHQFISRGDTVYASLDAEGDDKRYITLRGQKYVPGDRPRILLPLVFCRECGQTYYTVWRKTLNDGRIVYRPRNLRETKGEEDAEPGFLYFSQDNPWPKADNEVLARLPDDWLDQDGNLRRDRRKDLPARVHIGGNGRETPNGLAWTFIRAPFRFCLSCGVSYDFSQKSDYPKLTPLGTEGRSSATTILSLSSVQHMGEAAYDPEARKLLSFTDNRQDASLQAGHFNDFVDVGLLRSALFRAVQSAGANGITHDQLTQKVFEELRFPFAEYAHDPGLRGHAKSQTEATLREVLGYRLYRDLRRGWRLLAPNLEQVGLLDIDYPDLEEACHDEEIWAVSHPAVASASPETRANICRTLLDHMRRAMAVRVEYLQPAYQEGLLQRSRQHLEPPWGFDENETLRSLTHAAAVYPRSQRRRDLRDNVYVSPRGGFGRYLRRVGTLPDWEERPSLDDTAQIIKALLEALRRYGLVCRTEESDEEDPGYQVNASAILWQVGDGTSGLRDPIRQPTESDASAPPNPFFLDYYRNTAQHTLGIRAREHTAQVPSEVREQRENEFRSGKLPILFCSPTMELGIDIAQLNAVNLRNVPPTPANYAQRSGRAGHSGQPALVFTYCSGGSPHDQYFFRHADQMVSGAVVPPRVDLTNEDLMRAHVHAIWLSEAGISLGKTLTDVLDTSGDSPSLELQRQVQDALSESGSKQRTRVRAERILEAMQDVLVDADWYREGWLEEVLAHIPLSFDQACRRWRDLYLSAHEQAERQGRIVRDSSRPAQDRKRAERLRKDAETQLKLLTEAANVAQSDFYSYRYFASEGFLPGYNFPRLPLSAFIPGRKLRSGDEEFLSRPRFLAITEFGPRAIIYHEGSQYVISQVMLPAQTEEELQTGEAKICDLCGYLHPCTNGGGPDKCEMCGADLPAPVRRLFRLRNVVTRRRERITCDEEERLRLGYEVHTVVRFAERDGNPSYRTAEVRVEDRAFARIQQGNSATLWRVNFGWKRRKESNNGFKLDVERGYWAYRQDEEDDENPLSPRTEWVVPYVEDTKNCLIFHPENALEEETMVSFQAALKTAIQTTFELEDRELATEPLPSADHRRSILFYEATEGGLGVLRRLLEAGELNRVARKALEICHFDPDTGEDLRRAPGAREDCEAACYDCLLSYTNQQDHEHLDRKRVKEILIQLMQAEVVTSPSPAPRSEHFHRLLDMADSELEKKWLRYVQERNLRLPTHAQALIESCVTRPDFLYRDHNIAIYIDGPPHDYPERAARDRGQTDCMEDLGWTVIRFGHADDWAATFSRFRGIFGGSA